jgi:hypothetical protein
MDVKKLIVALQIPHGQFACRQSEPVNLTVVNGGELAEES